jgi:hypothetical protein
MIANSIYVVITSITLYFTVACNYLVVRLGRDALYLAIASCGGGSSGLVGLTTAVGT